ncbi:MAG: phosphatidylinositol kinase [Candidatus Cloacimonetes bacterium]|mgnify:CR=1 FL=1|jgi:serine/threonine-protein kinase HipA|nr:phosphatidylinositol kinase [Candidatus Cloacimonadota bacterium]MBT6994062.1 phosphatidylinositol kinase [Candidatus Cloacimonadota bacterium]MBT7468909.1 phosphatidylinositol kinase [Candidatus Cloacimonadota bacterium]
MSRMAKVFYQDQFAGIISETDEGYLFRYEEDYLQKEKAKPVSLTLPLRKEPYKNKTLFPFFDGLIPEGWLLNIAKDVWNLNIRDRMGLLLTCCKDCIGAVSIIPIEVITND